jgi:hypothetical protein
LSYNLTLIVAERHPLPGRQSSVFGEVAFIEHQARVLHQISPAPKEMNRPEAKH